MTKAQSVYQYEAPRCPDGWNEAERRFYSRVIEIFDDIYIKYGKVDKTTVKAISQSLGDSSVDNFEGNSISAGVANIVKLVCDKAVIDVLSAGQIAAYSFEATFGHLVTLSAKLARFDFETVKSLISQALIVEEAVGTNVRIKNLVVDYAQMSVATIENLCIKAEDGKYYVLSVDPEGKVSAKETTVEEVEIAAGVTSNGNVILETDILATNLTTSNLYASVLLANEITAYRIDVDALTARDAFIQSLTSQQAFIKWLQTEEIVGDKSLTMIAGEAVKAQADADFATPNDSEESPATAPAAGKLWIDRGTTPPIFRRWKGINASTDREWIETSSAREYTFNNSDGRFDQLDSMVTVFTPRLTETGTPTPSAPLTLTGIHYANMRQNNELKGEVTFGETLYGVEIDWLNGTWKQTHWVYVLTGTESVSSITHNGYQRFAVTMPEEKRRAAASLVPVCTHLQGSDSPYGWNSLDNAVCVDKNASTSPLYIRCDAYATVDAFKAWLAEQYDTETPVKVAFQMKEPIVHSMPPVTIHMSQGNNVLFAGRLPVEAPEPLLNTVYICSGWETLNSADDIRRAQTEIQTAQQNAQAAIDELRTAVVTDNEGVHIRKVDNDNVQLIRNEVLITQKDVNVKTDGKINSTFGSGYVRLLDMIIRVGGGGLVIEAAEV